MIHCAVDDGSCDNCGASTHKAKECMDRPRKVKARYSGLDLKPDELVETFELGFDAKRDRYAYTPSHPLTKDGTGTIRMTKLPK